MRKISKISMVPEMEPYHPPPHSRNLIFKEKEDDKDDEGCCSSFINNCHFVLYIVVVIQVVVVGLWLFLPWKHYLDLTNQFKDKIEEESYLAIVNRFLETIKEESEMFRPDGNKSSEFRMNDNQEERNKLLDLVKCQYKNYDGWAYVRSIGNLPGHACGVPVPGSSPSVKYLTRLSKRLAKIECSSPSNCKKPDCDPFISVFERSLFCFLSKEFDKPELTDWKSDKAFSSHFIQGVNPHVIKFITDINSIHPLLRNVTSDDGKTPLDLLMERNLYLADYSILDSVPLAGDKVFYSPQVLLHVNLQGDLDVVAILLRSNKGVEDMMLTKLDKASQPNKYLFAKMHVANADSQVHEMLHHLPVHFVMETVSIAHHNHLDDMGHIVGRLLKPHMKGTIFINFLGRNTLIKEEESDIDLLFSVGLEGALAMIDSYFNERYNFSDSAFPTVMERRGFPEDETDGVKNFFYRTDGFKIWNILKKYVSSVVDVAYSSDEGVLGDGRLQKFCEDLADPDKGNIPGFPSGVSTKAALVDLITQIIFTASVEHQAVNAPHHVYSYVPHRPTLLTTWMPQEPQDMTWQDIKSSLPSFSKTQHVFDVAMLLSTPSLCALTDLHVFEDDFPEIQDQLDRDLKQLSNQIRRRSHPYDYLDPARVACSIDI